MISSGRVGPIADKYFSSPLSSLIDRSLSPRVDPSATIVLTGFWRSGTTWLLQSLGAAFQAKTVFEPLDPRAIAGQKKGPYLKVTSRPRAFSHTFMPFSEGPSEGPPDFFPYFSRALTSDLKGYWIRGARRALKESFNTRVVLKTVRGQLCLGALSAAFHSPVIHVTRDPRGIAASIRRGGWWRGWLDSLSLVDLLIRPEDGRERYFSQWHDEIVRFDSRSPLEKVIVYWALTEKYVRHCESVRGVPMARLFYDTLSGEIPESLFSFLESTGLSSSSEPDNLASPTTSEKRRALSFQERVSGWKIELPREETGKIEQIARMFALEEALSG